MGNYIDELYSKRAQLLVSIHSRDNLGSDASNTARALAAMDSVSNSLRREINTIDDEIDFFQTIMSEIVGHNVMDVINRLGGLNLIRERTGVNTVRLRLVVGKFEMPAEYSLLAYRDDKQSLAKQLGYLLGRTLYQLMRA